MLSVNMYSLWKDDTSNIIKGIGEATNNIVNYRHSLNVTEKRFCELIEDVQAVCDFWTGNTYVGVPKETAEKEAFQKFFSELMQLLLEMKKSGTIFERRIAANMLYTGKVYRYLGNKFQPEKIVKPSYDNIYVSWSKHPQNNYIESKLGGNITWLSCEITAPRYGIDLEAIKSSRGNEAEVVFPTIKECVTEIRYISEENDEQD